MKRSRQVGVVLSLIVVAVVGPPVFRNFSNITDKLLNSPQERVANARNLKEPSIRAQFKAIGVSYPPEQLYLRAFKQESALELWVGKSGQPMRLYKSFPIAGMSGTLGPKRKQGDKQVPEGFYQVDRFNPASSFHLSLGINYPNSSDKIRSDRKKPGSDIFIHGDTRSIGCLAMTDDLIREIYVIALDFRSAKRGPIPVHIFPFRMTTAAIEKQSREFLQWQAFWDELRPAYDAFEKTKRVPAIKVGTKGEYHLVMPKRS